MKERFVRFRSFWIFPLLAVVLLYLTFTLEPGSEARDLIWLLPLGLLTWSLLEYGLHRFVFHIDVENERLREVVNASHLGHHAAPRDPDRLLVHTIYGLVISTVLFGLLYVMFRSSASAAGTLAGIWAGFLYYESVHYRAHLSTSSSGLISWQRRAHFYHHFVNRERCFGVTSPLWDYVFRTGFPPRPETTSSVRSSL